MVTIQLQSLTFPHVSRELKGNNITKAVVVPRQIAMYLANQMTEASLPEIGWLFGGKHYTTVMHSVAKVDEQRSTNAKLDSAITRLLGTIRVPRLPDERVADPSPATDHEQTVSVRSSPLALSRVLPEACVMDQRRVRCGTPCSQMAFSCREASNR